MRYLRKSDVDQPQEIATHTIAPPAPLNFKNPEEWPKWIRRFERYRISTELNEKDEVLQINIMIYCIGDEADAIFKSFTFAERDEKKYAKVKEKFDQHFIIKRNVIFERAKFNMRLKQEPREPVVAFITDLYCLSEHCEFGRFAQSDETLNQIKLWNGNSRFMEDIST